MPSDIESITQDLARIQADRSKRLANESSSKLESGPGFIRGAGRGFIEQVAEGGAKAASQVSRWVSPPEYKDPTYIEENILPGIQKAEQWVSPDTESPSFANQAGRFVGGLAGVVTEIAATIWIPGVGEASLAEAPMHIIRLANFLRTSPVIVQNTLSKANDIYRDELKKTGDIEKAGSAANASVLPTLGFEALAFNFVPGAPGSSLIKSALKAGAVGGVSAGGEYATEKIVKDEQIDPVEMAKQVATGAVTFAGLTTAHSGLSRIMKRGRPALPSEAIEDAKQDAAKTDAATEAEPVIETTARTIYEPPKPAIVTPEGKVEVALAGENHDAIQERLGLPISEDRRGFVSGVTGKPIDRAMALEELKTNNPDIYNGLTDVQKAEAEKIGLHSEMLGIVGKEKPVQPSAAYPEGFDEVNIPPAMRGKVRGAPNATDIATGLEADIPPLARGKGREVPQGIGIATGLESDIPPSNRGKVRITPEEKISQSETMRGPNEPAMLRQERDTRARARLPGDIESDIYTPAKVDEGFRISKGMEKDRVLKPQEAVLKRQPEPRGARVEPLFDESNPLSKIEKIADRFDNNQDFVDYMEVTAGLSKDQVKGLRTKSDMRAIDKANYDFTKEYGVGPEALRKFFNDVDHNRVYGRSKLSAGKPTEPTPLSEKTISDIKQITGADIKLVDVIHAKENEAALKAHGITAEDISNGTHVINGRYFRDADMRHVIELSVKSGDPNYTGYHEAGHAVSEMARAIDPRKMDILEKKFGLNEEAIADGFAKYMKDGTVKGPTGAMLYLRSVYNGIKNFFEKVGNYFKGKGYQSVESIFGEAKSGKMLKEFESLGTKFKEVGFENMDAFKADYEKNSLGKYNETPKEYLDYLYCVGIG